MEVSDCNSASHFCQSAVLPPRPACAFDPGLAQDVSAVRREFPDVFTDPRTLARFLCGLTSPRLTQNRLGRHDLFGALQQVPFPEVLAWASGESGLRNLAQ